MSKRPKPKKSELARAKAMSEMGLSNNAIAKRLKRDAKTIQRWINSGAVNDPDVRELIDKIKAREQDDVMILIQKGRQRLHELLDRGGLKAIETMAIVDRCFGQRRLLEGNPTERINHEAIVSKAKLTIDALQQKLNLLGLEDEPPTHEPIQNENE